MSALMPIWSALPPGAVILAGAAEGPVVTLGV
jgi:hypothetical protein